MGKAREVIISVKDKKGTGGYKWKDISKIKGDAFKTMLVKTWVMSAVSMV